MDVETVRMLLIFILGMGIVVGEQMQQPFEWMEEPFEWRQEPLERMRESFERMQGPFERMQEPFERMLQLTSNGRQNRLNRYANPSNG